MGSITALASTLSPVDSQPVIVAAGQYGAVYFSGKGEALSTVKFERKGYRMAPIDLKGDGKFAFMNRGGNGQQVGLFDSEGREAWRYGLGANQTPNAMAAGDLNGDGEPEFVVGMNGNGGVRLLDATGKEKWRQPDVNVWQVEILDADGDRKNEIVHSNVTGRVCIRDAEGQLRREFPGKTHIAAFSVCTWPDAVGQWALLCNSQLEGIQLLDFSGNLLTRFAPPAKGRRVYGTPLRLSPGEKPYFALLVC
ncbi:MAG: FG-GAP repeat domain-containing protein, partial [Candidatus Zixiibacteriota bacterium]